MSPSFKFIPPEEAPVYRPTEEEFLDPLQYIANIRPEAERYGICKIIPPNSWQPPFAVDVDTFKFTPRIQRLNELEAKSRIKLNFLDQLAKFWELQKKKLKIPIIEGRCLDLYNFNKIVQSMDGYYVICKDNKWREVAKKLEFNKNTATAGILQTYFFKILHPYNIFVLGSSQVSNLTPNKNTSNNQKSPMSWPQPLGNLATGANLPCKRIMKGQIKQEVDDKMDSQNPQEKMSYELKKLLFYGPGPKATLPEIVSNDVDLSKRVRSRTKDIRQKIKFETVPCVSCRVYLNLTDEIIQCCLCDKVFHINCLVLPPVESTRHVWKCPSCMTHECKGMVREFGFEQASNEYTLQSFGQKADKFKLDYFNKPLHTISCKTVEQEFWRLVNCIEEEVIVEYGADIHSLTYGSGFPTKATLSRIPDSQNYVENAWNLNNIANHRNSLLRFINSDISGMKVPWCYVGMCFSSFAWHIEDHWNYSINYLHWGEPKTWYGVPGCKAELLESCMKLVAPELFEQSPDLLHQLTTTLNPNELMDFGVPIFRMDQNIGEYIVTFPRAYHAGFNQGFNFAEAVNFCTADWLLIGWDCVEHYREVKHLCVFSHEELLCRMVAVDTQNIEPTIILALYKNILLVIAGERRGRKEIMAKGTVETEYLKFEIVADDERQCEFCKTTCFLSSLICPCSPGKMVCIKHSKYLCDCPAYHQILKFRYTLDELCQMLKYIQAHLQHFDDWIGMAQSALAAKGKEKLDLNELRLLYEEAIDRRFPSCHLVDSMKEAFHQSSHCSAVARILLNLVDEEALRNEGVLNDGSITVVKLSVQELERFVDEVSMLPCNIDEQDGLKELLVSTKLLKEDIICEVNKSSLNIDKIKDLIKKVEEFPISLEEIDLLMMAKAKIEWLIEVENIKSSVTVHESEVNSLLDFGHMFSEDKNVKNWIDYLELVLQEFNFITKRVDDFFDCSPKKKKVPTATLR